MLIYVSSLTHDLMSFFFIPIWPDPGNKFSYSLFLFNMCFASLFDICSISFLFNTPVIHP